MQPAPTSPPFLCQDPRAAFLLNLLYVAGLLTFAVLIGKGPAKPSEVRPYRAALPQGSLAEAARARCGQTVDHPEELPWAHVGSQCGSSG